MTHTLLKKSTTTLVEFLLFDDKKISGTFYYSVNHGYKIIGEFPFSLSEDELIDVAKMIIAANVDELNKRQNKNKKEKKDNRVKKDNKVKKN